MKRLIPIIFAASVAAHAADVPQTSRRDNRVQYVDYDPADVVEIIAPADGSDTWVVLERDESIIKASAGFGAGWVLDPDGRVLTMKPQPFNGINPNPKEWSTNVTMLTDKDRLYTLYVKLAGENNELIRPAFRVEFRYPTEADAVRLAEYKEQEKVEKKKKEAQCDGSVKDAKHIVPRNAHYDVDTNSGADEIKPWMVFDDGKFTYLQFSDKASIPAIFIVERDGEGNKSEIMANTFYGTLIEPTPEDRRLRFTTSECFERDTAVVPRVAHSLSLRSKNRVVEIYNLEN